MEDILLSTSPQAERDSNICLWDILEQEYLYVVSDVLSVAYLLAFVVSPSLCGGRE